MHCCEYNGQFGQCTVLWIGSSLLAVTFEINRSHHRRPGKNFRNLAQLSNNGGVEDDLHQLFIQPGRKESGMQRTSHFALRKRKRGIFERQLTHIAVCLGSEEAGSKQDASVLYRLVRFWPRHPGTKRRDFISKKMTCDAPRDPHCLSDSTRLRKRFVVSPPPNEARFA